MNTIRMFAFVAAALITAFLFRVIAYDLTAPQHVKPGTSQATSASVGPPSDGN